MNKIFWNLLDVKKMQENGKDEMKNLLIMIVYGLRFVFSIQDIW